MGQITINDRKCIQKLHRDATKWISKLEFINYEIAFIKSDLLEVVAFAPYSKDLFEMQTSLKVKIKPLEIEVKKLIKKIKNHDNEIGGILECKDGKCDAFYMNSHITIDEQYEVFEAYYIEYKREMIAYASEILKHKKKIIT